jgi:hypothetical protein
MSQVGRELLGPLKEDVERGEVLTIDPEELRGWVARVGGQHLRVALVHQGHHLRQGVLDCGASIEACDVGRDLVADRDGEHLRAPREGLESIADRGTGRRAHSAAVVPRRLRVHPPVGVAQSDQDTKPQGPCPVQHVRRWHVVGSDSGEPTFRHRDQIPLDLGLFRKVPPVAPRREGAVGDPLDAVRSTAHPQMLPLRHSPLHGCAPPPAPAARTARRSGARWPCAATIAASDLIRRNGPSGCFHTTSGNYPARRPPSAMA